MVKRCEGELRTLIANQNAASPDKKSSFNSQINAKRNERDNWYRKYDAALRRENQQQSIKSLRDLLGSAPA